MRVNIELYSEELTQDGVAALIALINGHKGSQVKVITGRDAAGEETPADDDPTTYDPAGRTYGQKGEKSRRTKEEIKQDDDIAERWGALWPSKDVPEKPVGELEDIIAKAEAREADKAEEEEGGFEIDGTDDDALDLEEFRAIIVKHSKAIGGKKLGSIMAPHKNPAEVPEDERRAYADKIIAAAANAAS
jgi:hypothetical protein